MHSYSLTASYFFLVAQAAPLGVPNFSPPPAIPYLEDQPSSLLLSNNPSTTNSLLALTSSTGNQDLNTASFSASQYADPFLPLSTETQSDDFNLGTSNKLLVAKQTFFAKNCNKPDTCLWCRSTHEYDCVAAEIGAFPGNKKLSEICPISSTADSTDENLCITYAGYVPSHDCQLDYKNCHLCPPNGGTCIPAQLEHMTFDDFTQYICPTDKTIAVDCVNQGPGYRIDANWTR